MKEQASGEMGMRARWAHHEKRKHLEYVQYVVSHLLEDLKNQDQMILEKSGVLTYGILTKDHLNRELAHIKDESNEKRFGDREEAHSAVLDLLSVERRIAEVGKRTEQHQLQLSEEGRAYYFLLGKIPELIAVLEQLDSEPSLRPSIEALRAIPILKEEESLDDMLTLADRVEKILLQLKAPLKKLETSFQHS